MREAEKEVLGGKDEDHLCESSNLAIWLLKGATLSVPIMNHYPSSNVFVVMGI